MQNREIEYGRPLTVFYDLDNVASPEAEILWIEAIKIVQCFHSGERVGCRSVIGWWRSWVR